MASSTLVRRQPRRTLITPELAKRKRLTLGESLRVYTPSWLLFGGVLVLLLSCVAALVTGAPLAGVTLGLSTCSVFFGGVWHINIADRRSNGKWPLTMPERRWQVLADRNRRTRAHRADEKARLRGFPYPRYSLWVEREQDEIRLVAVRHALWAPRSRLPMRLRLLPWRASKTKQLYDARTGEHGQHGVDVARVQNPTVDKVMEALGEAQLAVEQLEANGYAEAFQSHQLDCLALAMQPPVVAAGSRARLAVAEEDVRALLEERV